MYKKTYMKLRKENLTKIKKLYCNTNRIKKTFLKRCPLILSKVYRFTDKYVKKTISCIFFIKKNVKKRYQ